MAQNEKTAKPQRNTTASAQKKHQRTDSIKADLIETVAEYAYIGKDENGKPAMLQGTFRTFRGRMSEQGVLSALAKEGKKGAMLISVTRTAHRYEATREEFFRIARELPTERGAE